MLIATELLRVERSAAARGYAIAADTTYKGLGNAAFNGQIEAHKLIALADQPAEEDPGPDAEVA